MLNPILIAARITLGLFITRRKPQQSRTFEEPNDRWIDKASYRALGTVSDDWLLDQRRGQQS